MRAAWLAIVALLVDALLPSGVAAAASVDAPGAPLAVCVAAGGGSPPSQHAPGPRARHCTLCTIGAAGLLLGPTAAPLVGVAYPARLRTAMSPPNRPRYADAQPRAPPDAG